MPVSDTINQFRQDVLGKGGPQISAFYRVTMVGPNGDSLLCYPMSVIIPGRQFVYYEHDLWGTNRKIPYKRGYTQCHMTLIAYQDWQERTFIERWMNTIIKHKNSAGVGSAGPSSVYGGSDPTLGLGFLESLNVLKNAFINGSLSGNASFSNSDYDDYIQYDIGVGAVQIECLNSQDRTKTNMTIVLKEAFPAAISQMTIGSDGSGYPYFNVTFQFNDYIYGSNSVKSVARVTNFDSNVDGGNPDPIQTPQSGPISIRPNMRRI